MFQNIHLAPSKKQVQIIPIQGDGNCLPRSLAVSLGKKESEYMQIKAKILEELVNNSEFYSRIFSPEELPKKHCEELLC